MKLSGTCSRTDLRTFWGGLFCLLLLTGCSGELEQTGKGIFSRPVGGGVGLGELPSLQEKGQAYIYPTFKDSSGKITRILWVAPGLSAKLTALLKGHPDWEQVKTSITPQFSADANVPGPWKPFAGTEALMLQGSVEAVEKATDLVGWVLRSQPMFVVEVRVVEVQETDEFAFGVNTFLLDRKAQNFDPNNPNAPLVPSRKIFDRLTTGRGLPNIPGGGSSGVIPNLMAELGTIHQNIQIDLLIQALKAFTKVDVVNTPNVAVLDGHTATISAGTQVPFFSPTFSGTTTAITTSFKDVSVQLQVIPRLIPPNTIRMTVKANVKNITDADTVTFEGISVTNPVIANREVQTTLDVPDGATVVLGGLITSTRIKVDERVPVLGDIPIVNVLFKSTHSQNTRNNLIFFIRPKLFVKNLGEGGELVVPPDDRKMPGKPEKGEKE